MSHNSGFFLQGLRAIVLKCNQEEGGAPVSQSQWEDRLLTSAPDPISTDTLCGFCALPPPLPLLSLLHSPLQMPRQLWQVCPSPTVLPPCLLPSPTQLCPAFPVAAPWRPSFSLKTKLKIGHTFQSPFEGDSQWCERTHKTVQSSLLSDSRTFHRTEREAPYLSPGTPHAPSLPPATTNLLPVSTHLPILDISCNGIIQTRPLVSGFCRSRGSGSALPFRGRIILNGVLVCTLFTRSSVRGRLRSFRSLISYGE